MNIQVSKGQYIKGTWRLDTGRTFESLNPATDQPLWHGQMSDAENIQLAYEAARHALPTWRGLSFEARKAALTRVVENIQRALPELVLKLSQETGKPLWESTLEIKGLRDKLKYSVEAYQSRTGEQCVEQGAQQAHLRFKPLGVVAVLGAFNFPVHLSHGHLIPALLAGNTAIFKPSELTPAIAEAITQCWHDADLPPGTFNLTQGDAQTAQALIQSPLDAVYFTGSYQTGQAIHAQLHQRPHVLLALEMGGNNPLIVDQANDLQAALYHTLLSCFITAGQRCSCTRRLLLPNNAFGDHFLERFIQAASTLRIGAYDLAPQPFMGPVIRKNHALNHLEKQTQRIKQGGKSLLPMRLIAEKGAFLSAGIIDMHQAKQHDDEEIFAPLVQVYRYDTFEEAIDKANQTQYGLTAGLFSDDPARYAQFYQHIRAGVLTWNRATTGASSQLPFGGIGQSGNHRPGAFFAADYCAYPVSSLERDALESPTSPLPGITV